jgi:hypothetical protein
MADAAVTLSASAPLILKNSLKPYGLNVKKLVYVYKGIK